MGTTVIGSSSRCAAAADLHGAEGWGGGKPQTLLRRLHPVNMCRAARYKRMHTDLAGEVEAQMGISG